MELSHINDLDIRDATTALRRCCGSQRWIDRMLGLRPFKSAEELLDQADKCWLSLDHKDWLEAFTHHPKIGDVEVLRQKYVLSSTQWEAGEQAGVATATDKILQDLANGNNAYEEKFGYIFIVCATGKSAQEMLEILKTRLPNDPDLEIKKAAEEQRKITRLRLEKLCQ